MEFKDLARQYQLLKREVDEAVLFAMAEAKYIGGPQVLELEKELAEYVGAKHCVSCANGTDALSLAMMAWGIGEWDAVFVPDFTFFSSGEIVSSAGATPIFVDVEPETFNLSASALEKMIIKVNADDRLRAKAVIAVDLFGLPADYEAIREVTDKYGLLLLEDGAQGFGGAAFGKMACSFGDISTTSFFPAKPLGCYGDGGAVFTDNDEWANLMQSFKIHGKGKDKYNNVRIGLNSRLDTIQAAVLLVKFKAFRENELRLINEAAEKLTEGLRDVVITPEVPSGYYSSWAQYSIRTGSRKERDELIERLARRGVPSAIYYPIPMHRQVAFDWLTYRDEDHYVTTNLLTETVLSLPMHPYLSDDEIGEIVSAVRGHYGGGK